MTQPDPDGGADLTPEEFADLMEAMGRPLTLARHRYDPETCRCTCGDLDHPEWGVTA